MQISSRFTVALHIFACVEVFKDDHKVTSDFLAGSIHTNPVIIRKILAQLKAAGLITVARGTGGITVNRPLEEISFFDVYQAIEPVEQGKLFHFHEAPNPECPVGRNIHALLDDKLNAIQHSMEAEMRRYTLADLQAGMRDILSNEACVKISSGSFSGNRPEKQNTISPQRREKEGTKWMRNKNRTSD